MANNLESAPVTVGNVREETSSASRKNDWRWPLKRTNFVHNWRESGINTEAELQDALRIVREKILEGMEGYRRWVQSLLRYPLADNEVAEKLVNLRRLTQYQADCILAGTKKDLTFLWLGQYKILQKLGEGGFGTVFLAHHENQNFALKVLRPELIAKAQEGTESDNDTVTRMIHRYNHEVEALMKLNHPNIVKVFAEEQIGKAAVIRMEYIHGYPFSSKRLQSFLTVEEKMAVVAQSASALSHAHEHGIIHRDVKPSNILVQPPNRSTRTLPFAKLVDFGLARSIQEIGGTDSTMTLLTQSGEVLGTIDFMSPEQAGGQGHYADSRTDVYSLGVTLYTVLGGTLQFPREPSQNEAHPAARLLAIVRGERYIRPETLPDKIDQSLHTIIAKATKFKPEDRYANMKEMEKALREAKSCTAKS